MMGTQPPPLVLDFLTLTKDRPSFFSTPPAGVNRCVTRTLTPGMIVAPWWGNFARDDVKGENGGGGGVRGETEGERREKTRKKKRMVFYKTLLVSGKISVGTKIFFPIFCLTLPQQNKTNSHQPQQNCRNKKQRGHRCYPGLLKPTVSCDSKLGPNTTTAGWLAMSGTLCLRLMVRQAKPGNTRETQKKGESVTFAADWLANSAAVP